MGGIDPIWFLTCDDPIALQAAQRVAVRRLKLEKVRDRNLAILIAKETWGG